MQTAHEVLTAALSHPEVHIYPASHIDTDADGIPRSIMVRVSAPELPILPVRVYCEGRLHYMQLGRFLKLFESEARDILTHLAEEVVPLDDVGTLTFRVASLAESTLDGIHLTHIDGHMPLLFRPDESQ